MRSPVAWRIAFVLAGALMGWGGFNHPRGTLAEMLAHPDWTWAHAVFLLGVLSFLVGLLLLRGGGDLPAGTARWSRLAVIGAGLMVVEMVVHTAAVVDVGALHEGHATPVLNTHLVMAVLFYPIFAVTTLGFVVASARERVVGSPWIAWIGVLGLASHGLAPVLVVALPYLTGISIPWAGLLFPGVLLYCLWAVLAGVWPVGPRAGMASPAAPGRA